MLWPRCLLAIAVGLAVGVAVGWFSDRATHGAPEAVRHHHHRRAQIDKVATPAPPPGDGRRRPAPQAPARPPTIRDLQQQLLDCVFEHSSAAGQTACLQALLQRELEVGGQEMGLPPAGGMPALPFSSPSQD
jgi:hypothetical protein